MTIINPNSISGISSITALNSTAAINLFKADGTAANIIAGVTTGANFKTGTSNLHNVGIEIAGINVLGADTPIGAGATIYNSGDVIVGGAVTATAFSGSGASLTGLTAGQIPNLDGSKITSGTVADARISTLTASKLSGALPAISGANLTSLPAQATIANNANNRVITGGSGVNLNGEANLTFDGSTLSVGGNISMGDSNRIYIGGSNDAYIYHDTANTHFVNGTGHLQIRQTANSDVITQTNAIDRVRIYNDGLVAIGQSSKSSTAGAGNLDIQGNATSCIIEMGNPFPTFSGGVVPEFRITATNSSHTVDFASVWGGDNLLHKHLSFSGGVTAFYKGTTSDEVARFNQNNFGVGTQSPGQLIHTHSGSSSGGLMIQSNGSTNYVAAIQSAGNFINGSTAGGLAIRSGNGIEFSGNDGSSVQMRLDSSSGNLTIGGSLVVPSGKGIDFSASGNTSSMTSELLDDYEEGTWLPSFYPQSSAMTHSYNLRTGTYVKIGSVVYWAFRMRLSGLSGQMGQTMGFAGLPYTVDNSQPQFSANFYGESYNGEVPTGMFYDGGTTRGTLYYHKNDVQNRLYASDLNPTNSYTAGSGFYFAA